MGVALSSPTADTAGAAAGEARSQIAPERNAAPTSGGTGTGTANVDSVVAGKTRSLSVASLQRTFAEQGAFLYLEDFLPPELMQQLARAALDLTNVVNRNYLPGHKQGGSVSRHTIDMLAPVIAELYRSPALMRWLETITGEKLLLSPADDPHAYALYYYTREGDHIGWHYDTSYYDGRRYTLLFGVVDDSSCRLDYELHTRTPGAQPVPGSVQYPPGSIVLFDGDKLRHRITPSRAGETRISLTFEYVTDARMRPWRRFVSNMKDAIAYFGFRQVFRRLAPRKRGAGGASHSGA